MTLVSSRLATRSGPVNIRRIERYFRSVARHAATPVTLDTSCDSPARRGIRRAVFCVQGALTTGESFSESPHAAIECGPGLRGHIAEDIFHPVVFRMISQK